MLNETEKSEIRAQYRDAKDQRKQIGILADLFDCPKSDILAVLGLPADTSATAKAPTKRSPRHSYEQAVREDVVKAVLLDGMSRKAAAEKFGVPFGNIARWVAKAKKTRDGFVVEADKLDKSAAVRSTPAAPKIPDVQAEPDKAFAERVMADLRAGIKGLHAFIDNFAGVDILSDDERDVMDRILYTASGFAAGVETGMALAGEVKNEATDKNRRHRDERMHQML